MKLHPNASEAVAAVKSRDRIYIQGGAATPSVLINALVSNAKSLKQVELIHLHTEGAAPYADSQFDDSFRVASLFVGPNMRPHVGTDRADYLPCFLSEIPQLLRSGRRPIDVAFIHVSPPDRHGFCSLGTSVDVTVAAIDAADRVIAQINTQMPRIHGDGIIHVDHIHHAVKIDAEIPHPKRPTLGEAERAIGRHVAELIEDGSTLQVGIGAVPDAVLGALGSHRDLGVHTEMWSDGMLDLIEAGVVTNEKKKIHPGKSVSTFVMGSQRLYDFVDDNPAVVQLDAAYVNNPAVIARNPKVAAINSAVEIDLTGQVCADSVGHRIISGVGGQMDFIRGASIAVGGKPILALPSRTRGGHTRIVSTLREGAGVVTTRAHVHYVVTEHGIADLYGKTLNERAQAMIAIAHPDDREALERDWRAVRRS